ncbi:hypothetical protein BKA70DRAFT_1396800 [Coprinopsis sp. MPI-PUGE-AT-0042]|nr:hypothetical protein BKA70DRAFT_1396800 [Coprinopsis sp. MPI-PUGE-AT-0042]
MAADLPSEVLSQIFTLAADEDLIFQHTLPTSLANSSWFRHVTGDWALRTPHEAANLLMRRSYRTKKAVMLTCKHWHGVGYELLFRCLFFNSPTKLFDLCKILQSSRASASTITSSIGWWTRRLHVCRYSTREFEQLGITNEDMQNAFVLIISHCPNLEIFHVDWPMKEAFGPVADALMTFSKRSIRTVSWNVPLHNLAKVIWALDSLKYVTVAHIEFEASETSSSSCEEQEDGHVNLGSANELQLHLNHLRQLSIRGYTQAFLEQATGWFMPALRMFSIDSGISKGPHPDVKGFLAQHGEGLKFLDLDTIFGLEIAKLLDYCPQLQTFTFNADWISTDEVESEIVRRPRPTITTIGLHGLSHAFGVGLAASTSNLAHSRGFQKANDTNMAALNRRNFPNLQRIRALNRGMLTDLNAAGQPSYDLGGMERWERWWDRCSAAGIRLEDCTGDSLGNLPDVGDPALLGDDEESTDGSEGSDEDEDDEEDSDEEEDSEDEDGSGDEEGDEEWGFRVPPLPSDNPSSTTAELRQLLEECRLMGEQREESMFSPMLAMMGGGMMGGGSSMAFGDPSLAMSAFQQRYGTTYDD